MRGDHRWLGIAPLSLALPAGGDRHERGGGADDAEGEAEEEERSEAEPEQRADGEAARAPVASRGCVMRIGNWEYNWAPLGEGALGIRHWALGIGRNAAVGRGKYGCRGYRRLPQAWRAAGITEAMARGGAPAAGVEGGGYTEADEGRLQRADERGEVVEEGHGRGDGERGLRRYE